MMLVFVCVDLFGLLRSDVRADIEAGEIAGAIPGAINIPLPELRNHLHDLEGRQVIVYCQVGMRGHTAAMLLAGEDIDAVNLDGGYLTLNGLLIRFVDATPG